MSELSDRLSAALTGRYTLERELGRGGTATVYLARGLKHDRPVALKVLKPDLAAALGPRPVPPGSQDHCPAESPARPAAARPRDDGRTG